VGDNGRGAPYEDERGTVVGVREGVWGGGWGKYNMGVPNLTAIRWAS